VIDSAAVRAFFFPASSLAGNAVAAGDAGAWDLLAKPVVFSSLARAATLCCVGRLMSHGVGAAALTVVFFVLQLAVRLAGNVEARAAVPALAAAS